MKAHIRNESPEKMLIYGTGDKTGRLEEICLGSGVQAVKLGDNALTEKVGTLAMRKAGDFPGSSDGATAAPQGSAPQGSVPQNNAPQASALQGSAPQNSALQGNVPKSNLPQYSSSQDNAPKESALQDNAPTGSAPKDNTPIGSTPQDNTPTGNAPQDSALKDNAPKECVIFCGMGEKKLDRILKAIRQDIPGGIPLKAVLTATNSKMTLEELLGELQREHERLEKKVSS